KGVESLIGVLLSGALGPREPVRSAGTHNGSDAPAGERLLGLKCAQRPGSAETQNSIQIDHQMGERVTVGPLTYNVIESSWRSQLGDGFKIRVPDQRFLVVTVSVVNVAGQEVSIPLL